MEPDSDKKFMKHVPNEPTRHNNYDVVLEDMDSDEEDEMVQAHMVDKDGIIYPMRKSSFIKMLQLPFSICKISGLLHNFPQ